MKVQCEAYLVVPLLVLVVNVTGADGESNKYDSEDNR